MSGNNGSNFKDILLGAAVFVGVMVVVLSVIGVLYTIGQNNRMKVERMTELCVANGHTGWDTYLGCFGGTTER